MHERTYEDLPRDVLADLPPESVTFDAAIPRGQVDVYSQQGVTRLPVTAFVRTRRKARKAERRNRRSGRQP
jgi:hypothetical protein